MPDEIILSITPQPEDEGYVGLLGQVDTVGDNDPGYLVVSRQGDNHLLKFECSDEHYSFTVSLNELMAYAARL